jgi:ADP-heptose:LPS heptosyltransferase
LIKYNKILAVSTGGLGDTILFSPLLKALRKAYPEAHIELLVGSRLAQEAYSSSKEVSHVTFVNLRGPSILLKISSLIPFMLNTQLEGKFEIGFYATGLNPKLGYFMKTIGIVRKIACAPAIPVCPTDFECNLMFARSIDKTINENDVFIPVSEKAELEAANILREHNLPLKNKRLLAIYPSTELSNRIRWELPKLIDVIKLIKKNGFNGKIIVVGSRTEGEEWAIADKEKTVDANLAGKLTILGTAALLKKCFFAIGNDGGIMHVAGAVGCPMVVIMPNTPLSYKPPGKRVEVIHSAITCCEGSYPNRPESCVEAKCTEDISANIVFRRFNFIASNINYKKRI